MKSVYSKIISTSILVMFISVMFVSVVSVGTRDVIATSPRVIIDDNFEGNVAANWTLGGSADATAYHAHSPTRGLQIGTPSDTAYRVTSVTYPCVIDFWFYRMSGADNSMDLIRLYDSSWQPTGPGIYYSLAGSLYAQDYANSTHTVQIVSSVTDDTWHHLNITCLDAYNFNVNYDGVNEGYYFGNVESSIVEKVYVGQIDGTYANVFFDDLNVTEGLWTLTTVSEDFEGNLTAKWVNAYPAQFVLTTDQAASGVQSLHSDQAVSPTYISLKTLSPAVTYPLQMEIKFKIDSLPWSDSIDLFGGNEVGSWPDGPTINVYDSAGYYWIRGAYYDASWHYEDIAYLADPTGWHDIFVNASSNSAYTIWIDGVLQVGTYTGSAIGGGGLTTVMVGYGRQPGGSMWLDDFVLEQGASGPNIGGGPATWAPTFTNSPATTGTTGVAYSYDATTNESSTFFQDTFPDWADNSGSDVFGTPPASGSYDFSFMAVSVAGGGTAWKNWTVVVSDHGAISWAPHITSSTVTSVYRYESYSYDANANETSTYYISTNASGLSINLNSGVISGTMSTVGSYYVHVRVQSTAGTLSAYQNYTLTVRAVVVTSSSVTSLAEGASYSYPVTATRPISSISITSNATFLSISSSSVVGTGPAYANHTYYVRLVIHMLYSSQLLYQNYTITMSAVAFAIISSPSITIEESQPYSYTVVATKTIVSMYMTTDADFLSLVSHTVSGTPPAGSIGAYWVNVTVNDTLGAQDSLNYTLTVSVSGGGNEVISCNATVIIQGMTVTCVDSSWASLGTIDAYYWNFGDGHYVSTKDAIHNYTVAGTYTVTHTVHDSYGREATATYHVTAVASTQPTEKPHISLTVFVIVCGAVGGVMCVGSIFARNNTRSFLLAIGAMLIVVALIQGGWIHLW